MCHDGAYGICLWCQGIQCSEYVPIFTIIQTNTTDTRVIDLLNEIRNES